MACSSCPGSHHGPRKWVRQRRKSVGVIEKKRVFRLTPRSRADKAVHLRWWMAIGVWFLAFSHANAPDDAAAQDVLDGASSAADATAVAAVAVAAAVVDSADTGAEAGALSDVPTSADVPDAGIVADASACSTPAPSGCTGNADCPSGAACVYVPGSKPCVPIFCTCSATTGDWDCESPCAGGTCKPFCAAYKPGFSRCGLAGEVTPSCSDGKFSCPDGTLEHAFFGCGGYVGQSESGIKCAGDLCTGGAYCCNTVVTECSSTLGCYAKVTCDGPEDCGGNTPVCCTDAKTPGTYVPTSCKTASACDSVGVRVCVVDGDCNGGQRCCKSTYLWKVDFGLCQPGC